MKLKIGFLALFPLFVNAQPSLDNLPISTPSDFLKLIKEDGFGNIALNDVLSHIKNKNPYRLKKRYGKCTVESDAGYDPEYGGFGVSCSDEGESFDITEQAVKNAFAGFKNLKVGKFGESTSFNWQNSKFKCTVFVDDKHRLFEYMCNYSKDL